MNKKDRVLYIDGLKGIACIGVFLYHFYTSFCLQVTAISFNHDSMDIILSGLLRPVIDGPLMVMLFAVISGWLVAHTHIDGIVNLIKKSLLRYCRFIFPIAPVIFGIWLLSKTNCFFTHDVNEMLGIMKGVYDPNTTSLTAWGGGTAATL